MTHRQRRLRSPRRHPGTQRAPIARFYAFTLLEVMVSIAVLAVAISVLLQVQARSILAAQQGRTLTIVTMLARAKLLDCEQDLMKKGFSIGDYKESGKFDDEDYPQFLWECHAYKPDLPTPDAADFAEGAAGATAEAGLGATGGGAAADPMAGMAMGMLGPVLSQISSVFGESIRELTVIVRWQEGSIWDFMQVTTHVVDTTAVNAVAQQMAALTGGIPGLPGAGGSSGQGSGQGSGKGNTGTNGGNNNQRPQVPPPPLSEIYQGQNIPQGMR